MDKKKVKELIEKTISFTKGTDDDYIHGKVKSHIVNTLQVAMKELSKSDWVSVEDGLPDLDELVVACNKNRPDNWWETFRDSQMADEWEDENGFPIEEKVTHWKPIEKLEE